jgi:hypothetical protein
MQKEFTVDRSKSEHAAHSLSSHSRRGAVSIVHNGRVYDNVHSPLAYAKRIFAVNENANVYVRFGSEEHQYKIDNSTHKLKIEFPWN